MAIVSGPIPVLRTVWSNFMISTLAHRFFISDSGVVDCFVKLEGA